MILVLLSGSEAPVYFLHTEEQESVKPLSPQFGYLIGLEFHSSHSLV